jgi:hypothetical protein
MCVLPRLPPSDPNSETGAPLFEKMLILWIPLSLRDFDLTPSHKSCLAPIAPMRPSSRDGDSICMDELVWQCLVGMQPVSRKPY